MASFCDLTCSQIGQVLAWIDNPFREMGSENVSTAALLVKIITCTCHKLFSKLTESEYVWYALNRFKFRVDPSYQKKDHHWPNVSSPRQLHTILSHYAPLEGFYVCATPYPFGLMLVLRFRDGQFVAELISLGQIEQTDNDDGSITEPVDKRTQVMSVSFPDGKDPQTRFCGCPALLYHGIADLRKIGLTSRTIMHQIDMPAMFDHSTIVSSLQPFLLRPGSVLIRVGATDKIVMADKPKSIKKAWNPHRPNKDPRQLLMSLLSPRSKSEIALAYLYGPAAVNGFVPKSDMPRPGLYVGSYGE